MTNNLNSAHFFLETKGIYKEFGSVIANNNINFNLNHGEIHALLGENGAGKTTFVNILYGLYNADKGEIFVDGNQISLDNPGDAINLGIGMVHQNFMLVGPFNTAENIFLGAWKKGVFFINPKQLIIKIKKEIAQYGFELDLEAVASSLPVGVQQRVEIVKALYRGAKILILDEPTAVLTPQETQNLFIRMRELKSKGYSIIFISHKLDEVLSISDRITVFRNGSNVGTVNTSQTNGRELAKLMIGHDLKTSSKLHRSQQQVRFRVSNLSMKDRNAVYKLDQVSFEIEKGQILGFAGIDGNGQMELANAISGINPAAEGDIFIDGKKVNAKSMRPSLFYQMGGAYIPQDRLHTGVVPEFKLYENLILRSYDKPRIAKWGLLQLKYIKSLSIELTRQFDIRPFNIELITRQLSGGNIQKVILARELTTKPSIIIASYPTRGLDIGATEFVYKQLFDQRAEGTSILLFSNELQELFNLSDLIAVIHRGKIVSIVDPKNSSPENIGLLMLGKKENLNG